MRLEEFDAERLFSGLIGEEFEMLKRACPAAAEISRRAAEFVALWQPPWPERPLNVLEIGCGTGVTSAALLQARGDLVLRALDNEPAMLRQARTNLAPWIEAGRLQLTEVDALSGLRAMPDDSVDLVASGYTLHNFLDGYRAEVIKEIHRVLRPGGLFVNGDRYALDDTREQTRLTQEEASHYFEVFTSIGRTDLLEKWILHLFSDDSPDHIMRLSPALACLRDAGMDGIDVAHRNGVNALVTASKPHERPEETDRRQVCKSASLSRFDGMIYGKADRAIPGTWREAAGSETEISGSYSETV